MVLGGKSPSQNLGKTWLFIGAWECVLQAHKPLKCRLSGETALLHSSGSSVLFKSSDSAGFTTGCARKGLLWINSFIWNSFLQARNGKDQCWNPSGLLGQWLISSFLTSALLFLFTMWSHVSSRCLTCLTQSLEVRAGLTGRVLLCLPWGGNGWDRSYNILKAWKIKEENSVRKLV